MTTNHTKPLTRRIVDEVQVQYRGIWIFFQFYSFQSALAVLRIHTISIASKNIYYIQNTDEYVGGLVVSPAVLEPVFISKDLGEDLFFVLLLNLLRREPSDALLCLFTNLNALVLSHV